MLTIQVYFKITFNIQFHLLLKQSKFVRYFFVNVEYVLLLTPYVLSIFNHFQKIRKQHYLKLFQIYSRSS